MGYRSDVGISGTEEFKFVVDSVASLDKEFEEFIGYGEDYSPDNAFRHKWDDVKYYDGYPDVDTMNNIMNFFEEVHCEDYFGFIRIGEETDDIETRGSPYEFDMYVNRSIEI